VRATLRRDQHAALVLDRAGAQQHGLAVDEQAALVRLQFEAAEAQATRRGSLRKGGRGGGQGRHG
jgi:hypothetical protein